MRLGESTQRRDAVEHALQGQLQGISDHHQVAIIGHIATRCAEMNDRFGIRTFIGIGVDMGHHIVAEFFFVSRGSLEVDIMFCRFHLRDLLIGNSQPKLLFRLREPNPELTPQGDAAMATPKAGHLFAGVAGNERVFVQLIGGHVGCSIFGVVLRGYYVGLLV